MRTSGACYVILIVCLSVCLSLVPVVVGHQVMNALLWVATLC